MPEAMQALADRLIAAFLAGDDKQLRQLGRELSSYEDVYDFPGDAVDGGKFVANDEIEEAASGDAVDDESSDDDLRAFAVEHAESLFEANDDGPYWQVLDLTASNGTSAFLIALVTGGSPSGLDYCYLGMATSESEARAVAQRFCYVDGADLVERYPANLLSVDEPTREEPPPEDTSAWGQQRRRFEERRSMAGWIEYNRRNRSTPEKEEARRKRGRQPVVMPPRGAQCSMRPEYFETRFRTENAAPAWPESFGIISAYATTGTTWSDDENAAADRKLREELIGLGRWRERVVGYSPNSTHAEPSWAVGVSLEEARDMGERFRQDAIYYVVGDALWVVSCHDPAVQEGVGSFRERVSPSASVKS